MPLMIKGFGITDVLEISLLSVVPTAIGALGVVVVARRSDRLQERRSHSAACVLAAAAALVAMTFHVPSLPVMLGLLSLAAFAIFSALP